MKLDNGKTYLVLNTVKYQTYYICELSHDYDTYKVIYTNEKSSAQLNRTFWLEYIISINSFDKTAIINIMTAEEVELFVFEYAI